jgi:hypothetical protein
MSAREVEELLGRPVDEWTATGDDLYWRWTRSRDGSQYYRYRVVRFLRGRVDDKIAHFSCNLD